MNKVIELVEKQNLIVFEDTCESLTSKYNGKYLGSFGDMASFSFYFSHHMTTIEGGMIVCKNEFDYNLLKCIRSHGWTRYGNINNDNHENINNKFCFIEIGYNLRPMEFQGAMGSVQLKFIDERNKIRKINFDNIINKINNYYKNNNILLTPTTTKNCDAQWFSIPLLINYNFNDKLNNYMKYLDKNNIENRPIVTGNFTRQPVMELIDNNEELYERILKEPKIKHEYNVEIPDYIDYNLKEKCNYK